MSRLAYTQRILEIVGNIQKQKEDITKVSHHGCEGWAIWADMLEGQMCIAWPRGDFPPSERQSYLVAQSTPGPTQ